MNLKFSQSLFFKTGSILFLIIGLGACFSLGYTYESQDMGSIVSKIAGICLDFLLFYFFLWSGRKAKEQEFEMPSDEEAKKIIEEFNATGMKKKRSFTTKKKIHKSVHK